MRNFLLLSIFISITFFMKAQDNSGLPYHQIPDYPDTYTPEAVAARMIDGLGFRYYWATEGLREEDLAYKPSEEARTSMETLDHIHGLSRTIYFSVAREVITRRESTEGMDFQELRKQTLEYLKNASDILRTSEVTLEDCTLMFAREDGHTDIPFWNNINGPIADAIWHCGQIVSMRRASGNPFNSKVSLFNGKLRE